MILKELWTANLKLEVQGPWSFRKFVKCKIVNYKIVNYKDSLYILEWIKVKVMGFVPKIFQPYEYSLDLLGFAYIEHVYLLLEHHSKAFWLLVFEIWGHWLEIQHKEYLRIDKNPALSLIWKSKWWIDLLIRNLVFHSWMTSIDETFLHGWHFYPWMRWGEGYNGPLPDEIGLRLNMQLTLM